MRIVAVLCQHDPQQASRELDQFPSPGPVSAKAAALAAHPNARKAASNTAVTSWGKTVPMNRGFAEQWERATGYITSEHLGLAPGSALPAPAGALPTGIAHALAAARAVELCKLSARSEDYIHDAVTLASGSGVAGVVSLVLNSWSPQTAGNFAQVVVKIAQLPPPMVSQAVWSKHFSTAPSAFVRAAVLTSTRAVLSACEVRGSFLEGAAKKDKLKEWESELSAIVDAAGGAATGKAASASAAQRTGPLRGVGVLHAVGSCVMLLLRRDNPRWEPAAQNAALACARLAGASPEMMQFAREQAFAVLQNYRGKQKNEST